MRWCNKPFPECCIHCSSHQLSTGSCGHSQRDLLTYYFAVHPDASCPVVGEPDVDPSEANPIAEAIADGCRSEDRFAAEYDTDVRAVILADARSGFRTGLQSE